MAKKNEFDEMQKDMQEIFKRIQSFRERHKVQVIHIESLRGAVETFTVDTGKSRFYTGRRQPRPGMDAEGDFTRIK